MLRNQVRVLVELTLLPRYTLGKSALAWGKGWMEKYCLLFALGTVHIRLLLPLPQVAAVQATCHMCVLILFVEVFGL